MAYHSQIDLGGLGEVPKTQNNEIFADMTDVYNAIHILAQWMDLLVENAQQDNQGIDSKPWESMPFKRTVWLPARQPIQAGHMVTVGEFRPYQAPVIRGVVKGAPVGRDTVVGNGRITTWRDQVGGIALTDAAVGELVQVGIESAVLKVVGAREGTPYGAYMCQRTRSSPVGGGQSRIEMVGDGRLISLQGVNDIVPIVPPVTMIGVGIGTDAMLFFGGNAPILPQAITSHIPSY